MLKPGLAPGYTYVDGVADADTTNLRSILGKTSSVNAIRFRNPTDSSILQWHIPTTGFTNITIKYSLESSSTTSGQLTELFDYSVDGGVTWKNHTSGGTLTVNGLNIDTLDVTQAQYQSATLFGLVTLTFGTDKTVENNPNLILRVKFNGNTPKTSGNNRWDNLTVEGSGASSGPPPAIFVSSPTLYDTVVVGQHKTITFGVIGAVSQKRTIEFSSDSERTWSQLAIITEGTSYDWIVPNVPTGHAFIRVHDTANIIGNSGSFAIVNPGSVLTITVGTTPGVVIPGDSALITWTSSGYLGATVNVDLSLDSQKTWTPIKAAYAYKTKSNYPWLAPTGTHLGAVIRLTFVSGTTGISNPFDIKSVTEGVSTEVHSTSVKIYPNPFTQNTTISYVLSQNSATRLVVYDLLGKEVFRNENAMEDAGQHTVSFNGSQLHEGTYVCQLTACGVFNQGKFMIVR